MLQLNKLCADISRGSSLLWRWSTAAALKLLDAQQELQSGQETLSAFAGLHWRCIMNACQVT
jgi:hypothetical protein